MHFMSLNKFYDFMQVLYSEASYQELIFLSLFYFLQFIYYKNRY
jgi:hypothetical protein